MQLARLVLLILATSTSRRVLRIRNPRRLLQTLPLGPVRPLRGGQGSSSAHITQAPSFAPPPQLPDLISAAFVHVCSSTRNASAGADPPVDYCSGTRTVDIALNGDNEVRGGRLLAMHGGRLVEVPRRVADAILLNGHTVTRVEEGVRYSLLLHFLGPASSK
ncbi:hypothetical protein T492DRAFT_870181 [Pavlovales sp. CCMP2436]|nr:hypothetical protein T492DRAFT_870181 [Pavlovales sp. CCMP2436]